MTETTPSFERWHEDISGMDGIQRVSITSTGIGLPEVGVVYSDAKMVDRVRSYYDDNAAIPMGGQMVSAVHEPSWTSLITRVGAREILDYFVGSEHIEKAAAKSHEAWRANKQLTLEDPEDPFHGYGLSRRKVKDLTDAERVELGILTDADPTKDVFHPLFQPFMDIAPDVQHKNVVPMAAACLAVGDFLLDDDARIGELDDLISNLGRSPRQARIINMVTHVAWAASDITLGGRPWGEAGENYHLFSRLSPEIQDLDAQAAEEPLSYIRDQVAPISNAFILMRDTLYREGGSYEDWWGVEYRLLEKIKQSNGVGCMNTQDLAEAITLSLGVGNHLVKKTVAEKLPAVLEASLKTGDILLKENAQLELSTKGKRRLAVLDRIHELKFSGSISYLDRYTELKDKYSRPTE